MLTSNFLHRDGRPRWVRHCSLIKVTHSLGNTADAAPHYRHTRSHATRLWYERATKRRRLPSPPSPQPQQLKRPHSRGGGARGAAKYRTIVDRVFCSPGLAGETRLTTRSMFPTVLCWPQHKVIGIIGIVHWVIIIYILCIKKTLPKHVLSTAYVYSIYIYQSCSKGEGAQY